jgi:putative membrane protein
MTLAEALPTVNATLNATSAVLLFAGWRSIKSGRRDLHKKLMLATCASSVLFLICYFTRVALTGTHRYPGDGTMRVVYLAVLGTHTILAAATLPMAIRSLFLSLKGRFEEHRRIARWTFPVWLYVSVTGVVVYFMLYHRAA